MADPCSPSNRHWNLGFKTAAATYDRLQAGVGKILTDRKITNYLRRGFYGEGARLKQLELDKAKPLSKKKQAQAMVDDLV